jgi:hypothetical protein
MSNNPFLSDTQPDTLAIKNITNSLTYDILAILNPLITQIKWQATINYYIHYIPEINLPNDRSPRTLAPYGQTPPLPPVQMEPYQI